MSQQGLILGFDSNCSGLREKRTGCFKELRNGIKPKFHGDYVSTVQRLLNTGENVVLNFQTPGFAGLQCNGNSWLLGATDRRGQPISTVNPLKAERKHFLSLKMQMFNDVYVKYYVQILNHLNLLF